MKATVCSPNTHYYWLLHWRATYLWLHPVVFFSRFNNQEVKPNGKSCRLFNLIVRTTDSRWNDYSKTYVVTHQEFIFETFLLSSVNGMYNCANSEVLSHCQRSILFATKGTTQCLLSVNLNCVVCSGFVDIEVTSGLTGSLRTGVNHLGNLCWMANLLRGRFNLR